RRVPLRDSTAPPTRASRAGRLRAAAASLPAMARHPAPPRFRTPRRPRGRCPPCSEDRRLAAEVAAVLAGKVPGLQRKPTAVDVRVRGLELRPPQRSDLVRRKIEQL